MAFDINRLRTDQLQRLLEVGLDVNQLKTEELEDLLRSQEEVGDFGAGLSSLGAAAKLGFAGITGDKRLAESAQRTFEEIQLRRQPEVPSIIEAFEEEGLGAVGDIPTYLYEQLLFSAPQMAAQLGAGAIATRFGGPRAGMAAATAAGAPAFAGYNIQRQIEEQGIGIEDAQVAKAFAVGTGQAALDALLGRTIGVFGRTKGAEEIAKAAQRGMATRIARKAGEGAALEAVTESGQQVLEILQANPEKFFEFGPEVQRELAESAIAGGLLGGTIAAPAGIARPRDIDADRQKDLEAHMQEEAEETRRMEEEAARFEQEQKLLEKQSFELPSPSPIAVTAEGEAITPYPMPTGTERTAPVIRQPRADVEGLAGLPAVVEGETAFETIEVPPGGFRDPRERIQERVREPAPREPEPAIEGELLPRDQFPVPYEGVETDDVVATVDQLRLPRGTGAIYVPSTARQRGTLEGRLAGLTEVIEGVEQPSTARAEEAFRERIRAGMANPFNDQEAAKLLEKLNQLELEGKRKAAQNVRKRLEERLGGLGVNPEQTADLLAATPSQREQLKMFSQRAGAQAALDTRETAKKAYDSVTTSQFNQATERVRKALQRELRKLGLGDVALRMDNVIRPEPGTLAEGVTEQTAAGKVIIALSSKIYSPDMTDAQLKAKLGEVMNHEMIHAMKTLGLFTDAEYQSLVNAAREQKFVDKTGKERLFSYFDRAEKLYKNDSPEIKQEEAVAELFRDWAAGRRTIGGKPPTLFQKIIKFIKTLGGLLNKEGFDDPSKIFEAIQAGEIGRRERVDRDSDIVMYSRKGTPEMGINVRYDAGSGIDYAEEIVSGRKTLETRNTDSLRPYVGQRVGIVRTGRGPSEAIGAVTIGEPISANQAEFDSARDQHLVPAGSAFDIEPGGTKFMYPMLSPEIFDQPVTVGKGIVARKLDSAVDKKFSRRAMANPYNVNIDETIVPIYPGTENALNRKQGSVKKEVFAREMLERSGLTDLIPYNEDTQEQVARKMATEALMALEFDNNAIGWYDEKLRQAKNILNLVEPSIFENETNETTFDYALAVTSNGTAVIDNFPYALQAYRFYQENGRLPVAEWKQGGKRNKQMKRAFKFFNDYQTLYNEGQIDLPLSSFLDSQYQVRDLKKVIRDMRDKYNIKISVPSGEGANALIRGSLILGPKIGQGFYQNLRGNFNELTADQWWMRMWNRMVGNPFKVPPTKEVMQERRTKLRELIRAPEGPIEKQIIQQAFDRSGLRPSDLRSNKNLDEFSVEIRSRWNSYYRNFQKAEKRNPNKPKFFKFIDTYVDGLSDQLMDAPRGSAERQFMRDTTSRARELLAQEGVDINTADFQALLWYPEKRLWLSGGVAPGRGSDNDYADAAIETARQEGIANERIEEALADSGRVGISSGRYSRRAVPGTDQGTGQNAEKRGARDATRAVANSAGPNGQVWNVSRRSGTIREANVIASYRVAPEYESEYASGGVSTPEMFELEQSPKSAEAFETAITEATSGSPYAPAVYVYSREKYADMRLFLSGDSNAGFAVKGDDIVSVFNGPTSGLKNVTNSMLRLAFEQGGRRLDAFDTVLPDLYSNNLFKAIVRLPWDDKEAPNGWDKELFSRWKNGEPDVVFMAYDPTAKPYKDGDGEYANSYDEAVEIQQAAASRFSRRYSATAPSGQFNLDDMVDRLVSKEPETSPIMKIWDKFFLGRLEGETRWQAFTRNAVNRFLPGYLLDNYVNGEIADPANSVGRAMELSQSMTGRLWALAELGAMKFNPDTGTAEVIEAPDNIALRRIFEPIGEKYMRQFFAYAIAKRELKMGEQGRKGFKNLKKQDAVKIISESEAKYPFFREVHNNYALFNRRMVQMAVDSGLITKDQGDNFMNMDYVPYYRYAESATDPSEFSKAMAAKAHQSLKDPNVFEKELEGGTIPLGDMYENITKNAGLIVSASLKNYAMQKTADALDKASAMDGPKSWGRKAKEGETGQMITFYRNGEKVLYKIDDPALWTAVAGLTAKQKESFVKGLEMVGGILRAGVTIPPGFQLANLWRGKIDAYVKTGIPVYRFDQTVKAMRDVYANDKDTQRFKIITGMGGYLYGADAESLANTLKRGYRLKEPGGPIMQQIGDRLRQAYTALEKTGEASEMAERIVIMRKLMAEGVSEREAAFQGLNLINFGRRGAGGSPVMSYLVNFLIPTVTFLNARIQGLARLIEDPNTPGTVKAEAFKEIFARGMLVTAGSVTLGLLAMQDDRWEDESVIEKVTNDIIYIGDVKIRIPKAFEIGALFGTIPVMTLDAIRQERANDLAQAVGHIFVSTFSFSIVPQGLLPVLEVIGNYDSFRAAPIEGISLQRLPTELRAYESTPEIYKFLSRNGGSFIRLSPLEIQQLIEGYLGTMATNVIATTDTLLSATGAIPEKPSGVFGNPFVSSTASILGLNRFVREDGAGASRFVSEFYEMRRDLDQTYTAMRDAAERGQTERVNELMQEKGKALSYRTYFNNVARQLSEVNKAIDTVRFSQMDSDAKKERLKELRKTKVRLTQQIVTSARSSGYFD
jgi:hypothetical protein